MKIELPHVGESVTEAVIDKWLKRVGDSVEKFDPLAEVVTDKVSMEMPSPATGILTKILVQEGQTVLMGTVVAEIAVEGEELVEEGTPLPEPGRADRIGSLVRDVTPVGPTGSGGPITTGTTPEAGHSKQRFSPAVMRLAQEHGIDLAEVEGTGINGRITRKDVQAFVDTRGEARSATTSAGDERVPLTPVRRIIAENMARSASEIPEAWTTVEADVTDLVALREGAKAGFQKREGVNLTYLAFVLKAVAEALEANPIVNSSWDGDAIIMKKRVNIGVATNAPDGLVVPVVHDAGRMDVPGLAKAIDAVATRARKSKLELPDVQGGTFTVNNTGALGSVTGKAIINHPEAAILNTEAIVKRPVVVDDEVIVRSMMNLCLTFDHRVMDGAEAGAFVNDVKSRLESIDPDAEVI